MSHMAKNKIIGSIILGVLIILYVIMLLSDDWHVISTSASIILCCYFFTLSISGSSKVRIKDRLYKRCDPDSFNSLMLKNYPKESRDNDSMSTIYSIARGLIAAGRFEEALAELDRIDYFPEGSFSDPSKRYYYELLVPIYIGINDIGNAEKALGDLKQIAQDENLSIVIKKTIKKQYEESALLLNMAKGNFEGAEEFFIHKFIKARNNYNRVCAQYRLGEVYLHYGETIKAKDAFEYVSEHGNKLYIAAQARSLSRTV